MSLEANTTQNNNVSGVLSNDPPEEDVFNILVATDIHLGYNEHDPNRGNDSFNTFEEILKHGAQNNVDFILLGGDLFHESKPSPVCYHRCISLLKKYCLGDKPVAIEFLSDQSRNFQHMKNPIVNYEDPNLNIAIPVFSIHGNHDDPTGATRLSAMDIIADTGLINYFGKWTDLTQVEIYPLLLRKGATKLALYGLSHIKDERLSRLFRDKKVVMTRPNTDDWFNIFVLHQNRAQNRGLKNHIPETVLPEFINLVIWGHEHDCRIDPEVSPNGNYVSQPGSSVATSLAMGESLEKYVGLLKVHKDRFIMNKIKLNTVRPFIFKEITITKPDVVLNMRPTEYSKQEVANVINSMIEEAKQISTPESPKLPLLRLVVNFTDDSLMSNAIRMGQQYIDKVANPVDMLTFKLKKPVSSRKHRGNDMKDFDDLEEDQIAQRVEELVDKYFEAKNQTLSVLSVKGLTEAVTRYIDRNDTDALSDIYNHQYNKTLDKLMEVEGEIDEDRLDELIEQFRLEREERPNEDLAEVEKILNDASRTTRQTSDDTVNVSSDEDVSSVSNSSFGTASTSRGGTTTGRPARGRGSRGPRKSRARGRAS